MAAEGQDDKVTWLRSLAQVDLDAPPAEVYADEGWERGVYHRRSCELQGNQPTSGPRSATARYAEKAGSSAAALGVCLLNGWGGHLARPHAAAERLEEGVRAGCAWCALHLGEAYMGGQLPPPSGGGMTEQEAAVRLYGYGSLRGLPEAVTCLGGMYEHGTGVPQCDKTAARLWLVAARFGDPHAQQNLAFAFRTGAGCPRNDAAAAYWYSLAAEQGSPSARLCLSALYARGVGVPKDAAVAARLRELAFLDEVL